MVFNKEIMKDSVILFLKAIGEDLNSPHIKETPERASKMWEVLLGGKDKDLNEYVKLFPNTEGNIKPVMITNINFFGFCSHHILPFYGQISVAYIPDKHLIGLSKIARIARYCAKKLQVQENLTKEICEFIQNCKLKPKGVSVIIDAEHMCASQRGVRAHGMRTRTEWQTGEYLTNNKLQDDFILFANQQKDNLFRY